MGQSATLVPKLSQKAMTTIYLILTDTTSGEVPGQQECPQLNFPMEIQSACQGDQNQNARAIQQQAPKAVCAVILKCRDAVFEMK